MLREAALAGAGIAMLPTYYVVDDLRRGALVRLLPDHEPEPLGIHAVYLSRQHQPQALRLLIEFLAERFGGDDGAVGSRAPACSRCSEISCHRPPSRSALSCRFRAQEIRACNRGVARS